MLVTGQAVKYNRQILDGRWDKNDTKDAANVADLVSRGKGHYYDCPSQSILEIRALLSLRRRLKKEEHSLRMQIRNNLLAQYFPELDRCYSACESETLAIVGWCHWNGEWGVGPRYQYLWIIAPKIGIFCS